MKLKSIAAVILCSGSLCANAADNLFVTCHAISDPAWAGVGQNAVMQGHFTYQIENPGPTSQVYYIDESVCGSSGQCSKINYSITVNPHQTVNYANNIVHNEIFDTAGISYIYSTINISGILSCTYKGVNTITVK